jgi:hypothetical protein
LPSELDGCDDCLVVWDAYRDEYVEFDVGLDEEFRTQLEVVPGCAITYAAFTYLVIDQYSLTPFVA